MANEENLIPLNKRSKSVQREIQEKGRKANAENHRKKKAEKDYLKMILDLPISKDDVKEKLSGMGIDEEYFNNEMYVALSLFKLATSGGDLNAIKYIDERTGNNPQMNIKREELHLRKRELKLKEKNNNNPPENKSTGEVKINLSNLSDDEVNQLEQIINKISSD